MHSTLKLRESDPHDVFAIAPEEAPTSWADKVLADITRDAKSNPAGRLSQPAADFAAAIAASPTLEPNFRATATNDAHVPNVEIPSERPGGLPPTRSRTKSAITVFLFALCSAVAAASWQHYGDTARQMISAWIPPFALASSPPEPTGLTGQADTAADQPPAQSSVQASAADQAPPPAAPAQPAESTVTTAAPASDAQLQSMSRDIAAMGQQIEALKAGIADLKASQQAMARDAVKPADTRPAEIKPAVAPRPKLSALPPRPIPPPVRRPTPTYAPSAYYPPVQAAAPPPQYAPAASMQPAPPPPAVEPDGEPVVRPPMPLH